MPEFDKVQAIWHERSDQDPAHAWMRAQLADMAGENGV
jgi:DNA-binding transcriptional LysR family regulator